ncbi:hypothetical protein O9G_001853 [Rozella allomycis CSF55]|uniref:DUF4114 domain-containing protein n=1 Tax=Rozella allomycis (strain CSF55) TaxID=988480 RepID=A0A075AVR7_ROZAC|nr:hypothetical protein O9G_001853 [Rozella allomycis CSF55]|eukprot:EPZ34240.1 hypothetical protein O9G_001853 [Rozella allomycis CSF55]
MSKYFPETGYIPTEESKNTRNAFLDPKMDPNFYFNRTGYIEITLLADGAGYRNQFGVFLFDANNKIIPGSMYEVFPDVSMTNSPWKTKKEIKDCAEIGETVTVGPFPAGSRVGFYMHSNGAGRKFQDCKESPNHGAMMSCLANFDSWSTPDFFYCYSRFSCSGDPNVENYPGMNVYYSITQLNTDGLRHIAMIQDSSKNMFYLGWEDMYGGGDRDYNDLLIAITSTDMRVQTANVPQIGGCVMIMALFGHVGNVNVLVTLLVQ